MREIKFRAWDKMLKEMVFTGFHVLGETTVFDLLRQYFQKTKERGSLDRLNDAVIMQYTGLKDKNGKEIYEGDVLRDFPIENDSFSRLDIVEWVSEDYYNGWSIEPDDATNSEIIGNIYENPKLVTP